MASIESPFDGARYVSNDGNLCVYKGTGPGDNKGGMWCHGVIVSAQAPTAPPTPTPATPPKADPASPMAGLTSVARGRALDQGQANAVLGWIGKKVASDREPFCYKQSYGQAAVSGQHATSGDARDHRRRTAPAARRPA